MLARVAERVRELAEDHPLRSVVPRDALLVPAPGRAPLAKDAVWTPRQLAQALVREGVGARVAPLLRRTDPVRRSTGARTMAEREPPLRHFETIEVTTQLEDVETERSIVLVDDTVTTGSTLIACASRLASAFPHARITAFAAVRADRHRSFQEASEVFEPAVETIRLTSDEGRPWRS